MKILYPDRIVSVTAITEDAAYPDDNMLDEHPQKMWRAASGNTTDGFKIITSNLAVHGVGIFATNAKSGSVTVMDEAESVTYESFVLSNTWNRFFVLFATEYTEILHIDVELTADDTVYAGVVRCGDFVSMPNPLSGLGQSRDDHSIKQELSNGGLYIHKRNTPRRYDVSLDLTKEEFLDLDELYNLIGRAPVAMLLADGLGDDDLWSGFFHIGDPPTGKHVRPSGVKATVELREAV